jgi:3-hydroxyisobutyrate dehydrogenase
MGSGMAASLLRAGFGPALWNREPERYARFQSTAARSFTTAAEAVRHADVVITMVTDADAVLDLATGQEMLGALRSGAVWLQMSTIGVAGFERVAALVAERRPDVLLVDAPVTGSRDGAENGTLTILASGPEPARDRLAPVFEALGQHTLWLGPAGLGSGLKLANNTMIAFVVQGLGEAISVAHGANLTTEAVTALFGVTSFTSQYVSDKLARIEHGEYDPEFALDLALKDVRLALDTLDPARHPVLTALATQWEEASDDGFGSQDLTAITRVLTKPG